MGDELPKFIAAAVQAAPIFLEREATIDEACSLIQEAGAGGARLVVFPETWVPGYPFWIGTPHVFSAAPFVELYKNAVEVPSSATEALGRAAARAGAYVVIGINERDREARGTIYNSLLYIDDQGAIMGVHRKLMPSFSERTIWGWGDGSGLHVFETPLGRLGGLICWEHEMTLVKFALYGRGEQVHASVWPAWSNQRAHIDFGCRQYAYEGGCFAIVSCGVLLEDTLPQRFRAPHVSASGGSGIIDPQGEYLAGPVYDREEIVYAEIDLEATLRTKHSRDVGGHYSRPDVVRLLLNERPQRSLLSEGPVAELRGRLGELLDLIDADDRVAEEPEVLAALQQLEAALASTGQ